MTKNNFEKLVLVTGASGFVASHLIKQLLEQNYRVRGTVRSTSNQKKLDAIRNLVPEKKNNIEFIEADLTVEEGWYPACKGVDCIMHLASPFHKVNPKDPDAMIVPAVNGTKFVLEAALKAGVERVVLTSSTVSVAYDDSINYKEG